MLNFLYVFLSTGRAWASRGAQLKAYRNAANLPQIYRNFFTPYCAVHLRLIGQKPQIFCSWPYFALFPPEIPRHGSIEAAVLAAQGAEATLVDQFVEVLERQVFGTFAQGLHL